MQSVLLFYILSSDLIFKLGQKVQLIFRKMQINRDKWHFFIFEVSNDPRNGRIESQCYISIATRS
jgi:hypothetical protein